MLNRDSYFKRLIDDLLYLRVCVVLASLFFGGLFGLPLWLCHFHLAFWDMLGLVILVGFEFVFAWIMCVALFARDRTFTQMIDLFDLRGADFLGVVLVLLLFVLVGIIAIPITMILRGFKRREFGQ